MIWSGMGAQEERGRGECRDRVDMSSLGRSTTSLRQPRLLAKDSEVAGWYLFRALPLPGDAVGSGEQAGRGTGFFNDRRDMSRLWLSTLSLRQARLVAKDSTGSWTLMLLSGPGSEVAERLVESRISA